jgi:hypothetical protein
VACFCAGIEVSGRKEKADMKKTVPMALSLWLAMVVPVRAPAQQPLPLGDLQVSADTLGSVILGQSIKLILHDGIFVEGRVLRAGREEIVVQVRRSMPAGSVAVPQAILRTSDIATVFMKKNGSIVAPTALGVLGGILGLYGGAYAGYRTCDAVVLFVGMLGGAAGGAAAGAYAGREAAKKTVVISVIPADR